MRTVAEIVPGTGSEATRVAVITDTETQEKMLCMGLGLMPVAALVDFELTLSMPYRLTADTGIDSLCHALEAYVSRKANAFTDGRFGDNDGQGQEFAAFGIFDGGFLRLLLCRFRAGSLSADSLSACSLGALLFMVVFSPSIPTGPTSPPKCFGQRPVPGPKDQRRSAEPCLTF